MRLGIMIFLLTIAASVMLEAMKLQVVEGRPLVDGVYVNGYGPYRFLVDTGTNVNLIGTNLARTIGMISSFQVDLASATGKTLVSGSDGNEVEFGSVKAKGQRFLFSGMEAIHRLSPDIQGVLGQWFLSGFDYMLDLRGQRLEFGKQERTGKRSHFKMINARPVVSTSLGDLALDSGAARLVLFGIQPDLHSSFQGELRTNTGSQQTGIVSGKPLVIEGRRIWGGGAVAIPGRPEPGVDGLMPLRFFKSIYVCNSEGYVIFE